MSEGQDPGQGESLVSALVGEGKKYATIEELAKSRIEADNFIDTLKTENADLRKSTQEQTTIKDVMDAIKSSQKDSSSEGETPLDDESLQQKITETLEQRDAERTRNANRANAKKLVLDKLDGDESAVEDYVAEKAKALGMTKETLWSLSEESPSGFANLVGVSNRQPSSGNPSNLPHQNTERFGQSDIMEIDGHKTKQWYDKQRKEMGGRKFINDKSMQLGMLRAREALGEKFYS